MVNNLTLSFRLEQHDTLLVLHSDTVINIKPNESDHFAKSFGEFHV